MNEEVLKNVSVKITVSYNNKAIEGSGTIVTDGNSFFVITAEHCIYGKEREKEDFKDVTYKDLTIQHKADSSSSFQNIAVTEIAKRDSANDYVVLKIENPNLSFDFTKVELAKGTFDSASVFAFRGYGALHKKYPRTYNCKFKESEGKRILLQLKDDSFSQGNDFGIDVAGGLSGSGVFYLTEDKLFLIGIITDLRDENGSFDDFYCAKADLLSDSNLFSITTIQSTIFQVQIQNINNQIKPIQEKLNIPDFGIESLAINSFSLYDPHISKRKQTINNIIEKLNERSWIAINGDIFSGKSILLRLLANSPLKNQYKVIPVTLKDIDESQIISKLLSCLSAFNINDLDKENDPFILIIDFKFPTFQTPLNQVKKNRKK
jgi:hypothetical protein